MDEKKEVLEEGGDNLLMSALNEFNSQGNSEGSPVGETETLSTAEPQPEVQESNSEIGSVEKWLIDNKFKDDNDGKQALAKAYRELQSKADKDKNSYVAESEKLEKLKQLDTFLKDNPGAVKALKGYVDKKEQDVTGPPQKPEDYSILEEGDAESASAKWREEYDQWLINQGAQKAIKYVDDIKGQMAKNRQAQAEKEKLLKMGLTDEQIQDFYDFVRNPENVTPENLVNVWKSNKGLVSKGVQVPEQGDTQPKQKITSGASVAGATPTTSTADKERESFWTGIMKHSNKM